MTTTASTTTASQNLWLRVCLVIIAALELLDALSGVQNIVTDYQHDSTLLRFAQLSSVRLALADPRLLIAAATGLKASRPPDGAASTGRLRQLK